MKPRNCISVDEARKLQENWINSRGKEINRGLGYDDTREFLIKVSELQEYLDYVKEKSQEQGIADPGIRIYFGSYPGERDRKSFSTIFLAPTKRLKEDSIESEEEDEDNNYEIEPLNHTQGGWPPTTY